MWHDGLGQSESPAASGGSKRACGAPVREKERAAGERERARAGGVESRGLPTHPWEKDPEVLLEEHGDAAGAHAWA